MASPLVSKCAQMSKLASKAPLVPSISLSPRSAGVSPHPTPLVFSPSPDGITKSPVRLSFSLGLGVPRDKSSLLSPSTANRRTSNIPSTEQCELPSSAVHTPVTRKANGCGFSFSPGNSLLRRYAQNQFRARRDSSNQSPMAPWLEVRIQINFASNFVSLTISHRIPAILQWFLWLLLVR